ncbi:MAG: hypothetical protein JWO03_3285 [Bacteroidetes bacterium]|nr:hypothetical protein [Bacteroidota bacterium]
MKKYFAFLFAAAMCVFANAQGYEGALRIEYKDSTGKANNADIFIKGDKYYIKRAGGGSEKYTAYILDLKTGNLTCINDLNPKSAVIFNRDKVLGIYEKSKFKPGYKMHETQPYKASPATKKIGDINATPKKAASESTLYEISTADIKVNFHALIPVLRIAGFWNDIEDGSNAILEGKTTNRKTNKVSTITVTPTKMKPEDKLFEVPKGYQQVDLNRFIAEQAQSPKLADLVRGLAGF